MKARLCNKDMCNLVDVLRELPETLEGVGVAGIATITVTDDGSISGVLAVSPLSLILSLTAVSGDRKSVV